MSETVTIVQEQGPEWSPSERVWLVIFEIERHVHGMGLDEHTPGERLSFRHTDIYGRDHERAFYYVANLGLKPAEFLPVFSCGIDGKWEMYQLTEKNDVLYWGVDDLEPGASGEEAANGMLAELTSFLEMVQRYPWCFFLQR